MANEYDGPPPKVRVTAGTAFKAGFFGALGVAVFYLVISVVLGIVALILAAAGLLPFLARYLQS